MEAKRLIINTIRIVKLVHLVVKFIGLKNMVKLQGCMVDALALEAEEGRDKLR